MPEIPHLSCTHDSSVVNDGSLQLRQAQHPLKTNQLSGCIAISSEGRLRMPQDSLGHVSPGFQPRTTGPGVLTPTPSARTAPKCSRNSEHIALFDRGGLLSSPWGAIDDGEHFVSASSRIAAHGVVVHRDHERSVPYLAL